MARDIANPRGGRDTNYMGTLDRALECISHVNDNGCGFDPTQAGSGAGITNLRDRLAAVGGELHVESSPGNGTRISGVIPVKG